MAIQTPLNFAGCSSLYKIRILLYLTSCIGPRKLDPICFLQFRYMVLGLPLLHGTMAKAVISLCPVRGALFLWGALLWSPEAAYVSLYSSPQVAPGCLGFPVIEAVGPHLPSKESLTLAKAASPQGPQPQHNIRHQRKKGPLNLAPHHKEPRLLTEEEAGESQEPGGAAEVGVF